MEYAKDVLDLAMGIFALCAVVASACFLIYGYKRLKQDFDKHIKEHEREGGKDDRLFKLEAENNRAMEKWGFNDKEHERLDRQITELRKNHD